MGKLNRKIIEANAKATGRDYALVDGGGLYLRVSRGGQRHWAFRYLQPGGKRIWMRLGDYGTDGAGMSLAEARAMAASIAHQRRETGTDPAKARALQVKEDQRAAALKQLELTTVGEVFRMMDARELSGRKDGGLSARRSYEKDIAPTLENIPIRAVTRAHVMTLLDKLVDRGSPIQANRTYQLIGQLFKFAILREIAVADPTRLIKRKDVGGREGDRERVLSEAEVVELAGRLRKSSLPAKLQHAVWILLSTLARVGELSKASWSHVDLAAATWTIPAENSENGRTHVVFLSLFAIEHFKALRALTDSTLWVLPARTIEGEAETCLEREALNKALKDRQCQVRWAIPALAWYVRWTRPDVLISACQPCSLGHGPRASIVRLHKCRVDVAR